MSDVSEVYSIDVSRIGDLSGEANLNLILIQFLVEEFAKSHLFRQRLM